MKRGMLRFERQLKVVSYCIVTPAVQLLVGGSATADRTDGSSQQFQ